MRTRPKSSPQQTAICVVFPVNVAGTTLRKQADRGTRDWGNTGEIWK